MENSSMFDKLVSGITQNERLDLLRKLETVSDTTTQTIDSEIEDETSVEEDLTVRLKNESIFFRIFLMIKSFFKSSNVEVLYNDHLVSNNAKIIEKNYPDILDYKHGFLLSTFYNKLLELKEVADFFKQGIFSYEENQGEFYVFLGSLIIPSLSERMEKEVDPYSLSYDKEISSELRASLLRKQEEVIQTILPNDKNRLYSAIQSLDWLKSFVKLPFDRIISRFISIVNGTYTCPIDSVSSELDNFAKVLTNGKRIYTEVLEALYLLSKQDSEKTPQPADNKEIDIKELAAQYVSKSMEKLSLLKMFINSVPIKSLAAISIHSSTWSNEHYDGVEDWFVKFKSQWRKNFDKKWESWMRDKRKYLTRQRIQVMLSTEEYPHIPNRPWKDIWGGINFSREYSLGFLHALFEKLYPEQNKIFKILMIEGDFAQRDNRVEFTDNYNNFNHLSQSILAFDDKLSFKGIYGSSFSNIIKESLRTIQGQAKIDSLMLTIEAEASAMIALYCESARIMGLIIAGVLAEARNSRYDTLTNIMSIQGKSNSSFRQQLSKTRTELLESIDIIKELETIEVTASK